MSSFDEIKKWVLGAPGQYTGPSSDNETRSRLACMNLHYACFALTDFGRAFETLVLYAPDFTGVTDGVEMDYEARVQSLQRRQENVARKTRHVCSNYLFRQVDHGIAYALSLVTIYLEDDSRVIGVKPLTVADCGEKYVRSDEGGWRIQYRYLQPVAGAPR